MGILPKSLIVTGTLFIGALIAATHELARALAGNAETRGSGRMHDHARQ
ncbi:hypothetical protein ACEXQB_001625 [Herbiconiux sp. P18]